MEMNKIYFSALILLLPILSFGQTTKVVSDLELRSSVEISKEVLDNLELSYEQEIRLNNNASSFDKTFAEFGAKYKINKYLRLGIDYRFYRNTQSDGDLENQQRWAAKVNTKYKIDRFTFKYKLQFQNKDEDFWANDSGNENVYNLRNEFTISYNIPKTKLKPQISTELYRRYYERNSDFNKIKFGAEISFPIKKWLDAEAGYYFDRELNTTLPASIHIMQVGFKFNF
jgi:Protein of unknown function (DUF2490)